MNWLNYIRKTVLKLTQEQLAEEIGVTQVAISRGERAEDSDVLPKSGFINLQELVRDKTNIQLPALWFFMRPNENDILSVFHTQSLPAPDSDVTGNLDDNFPAKNLGAAE